MNRGGAGLAPAPPTPPGMRVRTGRLAAHPHRQSGGAERLRWRRGSLALSAGSFGLHPGHPLRRGPCGLAALIAIRSSRGVPRSDAAFGPSARLPAPTTASHDSCRVTGHLSKVVVGRNTSSRPTPRQVSPDKGANLPRTPTASMLRRLDDHGLRRALPARPALYAQRPGLPDAPCVPRVAIPPPPSFPPHLATTQLASTCGSVI
jgi:hypothetical protein